MIKKFCQLGFVIAAALMFFSCVKEDINYECKEIKEGVPTTVTLKYDVQHNKVVTRAAQSEESEYRVGNLYVFIFDENGDRHEGSNFYTPGAGLVTIGDGAREGSVSFNTRTLNHATIVGIANVTIAGQVETAYTITKEDLDNVNTLNDLKAVVMKMKTPSVERTALFMMTGYARTKLPNGEETTDIQIGGTESGIEVLNCTLELDRTDAKVTFNVVASPTDENWTEFAFTPNEWFVYKVPQQSLLLPANEGAEKMDADGDYFTWGPSNFEEINEDENTYGFTFYMPENRKKAKRDVPNYAARDESEHEEVAGTPKPGQKYENGAFTYADERSTYVVLTGVLSYVNESGKSVNADVRYIIHLGYASGDPSDFDTKRNVHYTYNVTIKGVNNIVVEVTSENNEEPRPGYEGDVVYSANQIFNLDAHYDRCQLVINKSAIEGMTWGVKTPFSSGIHTAGATEVESYLKDYKWVKFAINADFNAGENQFVKYPGDGNDKLMDVQQLIERLQRERNDPNSTIFGSGNNVYITAFVEENVYFTNPEDGQEDLLLWKKSVDKDDRLLHIITDDAVYSADGNSSVVNSLYTFKQKAVRTVFDVNNENLQTAWGLESVMETRRMQKGSLQYGSSTSNGRMNTLDIILGTNHTNVVHWTDVLNTDDHYALNTGYEDPVHACLMRNRDLNGDNIIQSNEIRWYLAAIDQLTDIYIGELALDEKSRLYPSNPADRENQVRWHYISSSATNNNAWILWAEEGASRGAHNAENAGSVFSYRCARNLGLKLDAPDDEPEDLIHVTSESGGSYLIDATNLNIKARRSNYEVVPLPAHNERHPVNNLPYAKFRVHAETRPKPTYERVWSGGIFTGEWVISFTNAQNWGYFQTNAPYPAGYRIPNQRELLIMTTRMPENAWPTYTDRNTSGKPNYICQTAFSLDGQGPEYNSNRDGFLWGASSGVFFLQNNTDEKGYVRPVQDVQ